MSRSVLWAGLVVPFLLCFALVRSEASGTYYRPGASGPGRNTPVAKGQIRVGFRADFQRYSSQRLANGLTAQLAEVRQRTYTVLAEYGLTGDSSIYTAIPYVDNDSNANVATTAREQGFGDMKIGYNRIYARKGNLSLLGTFEVGFPLRNYKTTKLTAAGDNSVDLVTHFALRNDPVCKTPFFYAVGAGFRVRASQSPDQWLWDAELGVHAGRHATLSTFLDSIDSGNGVGLGAPGFNGDYAVLKQSLTRWGIRALFNIGPVDGELYFAHAIRFQNQAPFDYLGLGLFGHF